jgi:hypothetical protein
MAKEDNSEIVGDVRTSWAWWILPVLFTWLGGLIGWYCLKEVAPHKAKWILLVGVIFTAWNILLLVFLPRY